MDNLVHFSHQTPRHPTHRLCFTIPISTTSHTLSPTASSPLPSPSSFCPRHCPFIIPTSPLARKPPTKCVPIHPSIFAKKGGGSKRPKKRTAKPNKPNLTSEPSPTKSPQPRAMENQSPSEDVAQHANVDPLPPSDTAAAPPPMAFPGPLAPEAFESDSAVPLKRQSRQEDSATSFDNGAAALAASDGTEDGHNDLSAIPVKDEALLKLPDLNAKATAVRRKRKPRAGTRAAPDVSSAPGTAPDLLDAEAVDDAASGDATDFSVSKVAKLVRAYRSGESAGQDLIDQLEKEPDFVLQTADPGGEYDITSAIFGRGRLNKQGIYVLPYLQSANLVLIAIAALIAFVYYPGFPLTEAPEIVRQTITAVLAAYYVLNTILAVQAFNAAGRRAQPQWFWAIKTFLLGELAFGELRRNTRLVQQPNDKEA